jgi:hypothetical protein
MLCRSMPWAVWFSSFCKFVNVTVSLLWAFFSAVGTLVFTGRIHDARVFLGVGSSPFTFGR